MTTLSPKPFTAPGRDTRPPMGRLVRVELRKMTNTRAGLCLPIGVSLASLLVAVLAAAHHGGHSATRVHVLADTVMPCLYLLPIMGVLLLSGEWTQRTTLSTFTLVPSRPRVLGAKLGACVIVASVALAGCMITSLACVGLFGHAPGGPGSLSPRVLAQDWAVLVVEMIMGLAFASAILVSAAAIVADLLLPVIWNGLTSAFSGLAGLAHWLAPDDVLDQLTQGPVNALGWAHLLVLALAWLGIPLLVGAWRIGRGDIA